MSKASVLEKAVELQNIARSIAEGQKEADEQERVLIRIEEVRVALTAATLQRNVARLLRERTGQAINDSAFDAALTRFESKSRGGLPSNPIFNNASRALEACAKELGAAIRQAWTEWATARVQEVSQARFVTLSPDERRAASSLYTGMKELAAKRQVDGGTIRMFCSSQAELTGLLTNALQEVPEELIALISRIDEGGVSLHDLSDADIALLRDYDQDAWFTVTRKAD